MTAAVERTFLHVGCGAQDKRSIEKGFNSPDWREIRFDIDPGVKPDIVGTLTDLSAVGSESVDALYSSHSIEHIFPHEVATALGEFHRVLKADGFLVITCPDLQSVCEFVARDQLVDTLYVSPMGPIAAIDIMYGHRASIANGQTYMAHKCGFTDSVLRRCVLAAGFQTLYGGRRPAAFDLWLIAFKSKVSQDALLRAAATYLP